ncbi:hypothetical protein MMC10_007560 [Thelotrema lepadinum]|nr:hypothetical protein [Thelotrema lepadinum]
MVTKGKKRAREVSLSSDVKDSLEEPIEQLLEPCCFECAKYLLAHLEICRGGPSSSSGEICGNCLEMDQPFCEEVPAQFIPELNDLIRERNKYPEIRLPKGAMSDHFGQQEAFSQKLFRYFDKLEEARKSKALKPRPSSEVKKAPTTQINVLPAQVHEPHVSNGSFKALGESLSRLGDALIDVGKQLSVFTTPTKLKGVGKEQAMPGEGQASASAGTTFDDKSIKTITDHKAPQRTKKRPRKEAKKESGVEDK